MLLHVSEIKAKSKPPEVTVFSDKDPALTHTSKERNTGRSLRENNQGRFTLPTTSHNLPPLCLASLSPFALKVPDFPSLLKKKKSPRKLKKKKKSIRKKSRALG